MIVEMIEFYCWQALEEMDEGKNPVEHLRTKFPRTKNEVEFMRQGKVKMIELLALGAGDRMIRKVVEKFYTNYY